MKPVSTTHRKLGLKIKKLRIKREITQEDLAFKIGVDRSYMGFIERGERNPTLKRLMKIAQALKVSLSELVEL